MEVKLNIWDSNVSHCTNIKEAGLGCGVRDKNYPVNFTQNVIWEKKQPKWDGITLFTDNFLSPSHIDSVESPIKIGLIFEPKAHHPTPYSTILSSEDKLDFIFTHDQTLLNRNPKKYKFYPADWVCIEENSHKIHLKNKIVSFIYSNKGGIDRSLRPSVAKIFGSKLSLYGSGSPNGFLDIKSKSLNDYAFSIVMENNITDNYYTEKILDCFITGNVPIYRGCSNIGDFFDKRGIIEFGDLQDLNYILESLTLDQYKEMLPYIKVNYKLANQYLNPDDILYDLIQSCTADSSYNTKTPFLICP